MNEVAVSLPLLLQYLHVSPGFATPCLLGESNANGSVHNDALSEGVIGGLLGRQCQHLAADWTGETAVKLPGGGGQEVQRAPLDVLDKSLLTSPSSCERSLSLAELLASAAAVHGDSKAEGAQDEPDGECHHLAAVLRATGRLAVTVPWPGVELRTDYFLPPRGESELRCVTAEDENGTRSYVSLAKLCTEVPPSTPSPSPLPGTHVCCRTAHHAPASSDLTPAFLLVQVSEAREAVVTLVAMEPLAWMVAARCAALQLYGPVCAALLAGELLRSDGCDGALRGSLRDAPLVSFSVEAEVWHPRSSGINVQKVNLSTPAALLGAWCGGATPVLGPFMQLCRVLPGFSDGRIETLRTAEGTPVPSWTSLLSLAVRWLPHGSPPSTPRAGRPLLPPASRPFFSALVLPEIVRSAFARGEEGRGISLPSVVLCYPNPKGMMIYHYDEEALQVLSKGVHFLSATVVVYDETQSSLLRDAVSAWASPPLHAWDTVDEVHSKTVVLLSALRAMRSSEDAHRRAGAPFSPDIPFAFSPQDILVRQLFDASSSFFSALSVALGEGEGEGSLNSSPGVLWEVRPPPPPLLHFVLDKLLVSSVDYVEKLTLSLHQATNKAILRYQKQKAAAPSKQ